MENKKYFHHQLEHKSINSCTNDKITSSTRTHSCSQLIPEQHINLKLSTIQDGFNASDDFLGEANSFVIILPEKEML